MEKKKKKNYFFRIRTHSHHELFFQSTEAELIVWASFIWQQLQHCVYLEWVSKCRQWRLITINDHFSHIAAHFIDMYHIEGRNFMPEQSELWYLLCNYHNPWLKHSDPLFLAVFAAQFELTLYRKLQCFNQGLW